MRGTGHLQRVRQRLATDVGVEKHHPGAQLGQAQPGKQEGRAVFHAQRHHVVAAHAQRVRRVRHLVDAPVGVGIVVALVAIQDAGLRGKAHRAFLDALGHRVGL